MFITVAKHYLTYILDIVLLHDRVVKLVHNLSHRWFWRLMIHVHNIISVEEFSLFTCSSFIRFAPMHCQQRIAVWRMKLPYVRNLSFHDDPDKVGEGDATLGRCSLLHGHVQPRLALWCRRGLVGYVEVKALFRNGRTLQRYKGI